jgi:hypothetical protein
MGSSRFFAQKLWPTLILKLYYSVVDKPSVWGKLGLLGLGYQIPKGERKQQKVSCNLRSFQSPLSPNLAHAIVS